ncbi:glycosyl hydrolase 108 family protein [Paracraurococcus lichenis]|uniref:Glycosyl hydrolase 108 family protein n=1 Tax=Paracraurococcus lichenis TaxID=3064888 RepID=A0ABT9DVR2_9PROT|nr:glycosyl hydrolase 108 family protein [Paracraurococcus sp. LOR1-02]MDO9707995.1 glycosyl hydrolase 108 family protein [Paracraurococcus sp. LOR1-02]
MAPLIALGLSVLPDLARLLFGETAGTVTSRVADIVTTVTGESDAAAAKARLDADPTLASQLRIELAKIAAEAEGARLAAEEKRRQSELDGLREEIRDREGARGTMQALGQAGSALAWMPAVTSGTVIASFVAIVILLMTGRGVDLQDQNKVAILNIVLGALVAAFTAVINFWIGSSSSSRGKDALVQDVLGRQAGLVDSAITRATAAPSAAAPAAIAEVVRSAVAATARPAAGPRPGAFDRCVEVVLGKEGGFVDNPRDPGGATNFGITLRVLQTYRAALEGGSVRPLTAEDVRALSQAEAREIYRALYWNAMRCDDLPPGIDLMVFDFGVNAGPGRAVSLLQRLAGAKVDGAVGPKTLEAVRACHGPDLIDRYAREREAYYRGLPGFGEFGAGWLARVAFVRDAAKRLAAG